MVLGANCYVSTKRPQENSTTGATEPSTNYLTNVLGAIGSVPAKDFTVNPNLLAWKALYKLRVDVDVDIVITDRIATITETDRSTPWPRHLARAGNISWIVRWVDPTPPLITPERWVYVELNQTGGKAG